MRHSPLRSRPMSGLLQRSCQNCHRRESASRRCRCSPTRRPWAPRAIKTRTGLGRQAGVMPPWYIEKNIGIQQFKDDPSLSDEEIAKIAKWADSGAPRGNPPTCRRRSLRRTGEVGDRDARSDRRVDAGLIVKAQRARLVGLDRPEIADRPHRGSLRRGGRDQGGQRRPARRHAAAPSAAATSSTT